MGDNDSDNKDVVVANDLNNDEEDKLEFAEDLAQQEEAKEAEL